MSSYLFGCVMSHCELLYRTVMIVYYEDYPCYGRAIFRTPSKLCLLTTAGIGSAHGDVQWVFWVTVF